MKTHNIAQTSIKESRVSLNESHESLKRTIEFLQNSEMRQTQWNRGSKTMSVDELLVEESRVSQPKTNNALRNIERELGLSL